MLKVLNVIKILLRRFKTWLFISALALFITGFVLASFADAVSQDISLKNILCQGNYSDLLFLEYQIPGDRTDNMPYIELKNILGEQNLYFQAELIYEMGNLYAVSAPLLDRMTENNIYENIADKPEGFTPVIASYGLRKFFSLGEIININPEYCNGENFYKISPKKPFKIYGFLKEEANVLNLFSASQAISEPLKRNIHVWHPKSDFLLVPAEYLDEIQNVPSGNIFAVQLPLKTDDLNALRLKLLESGSALSATSKELYNEISINDSFYKERGNKMFMFFLLLAVLNNCGCYAGLIINNRDNISVMHMLGANKKILVLSFIIIFILFSLIPLFIGEIACNLLLTNNLKAFTNTAVLSLLNTAFIIITALLVFMSLKMFIVKYSPKRKVTE